MSSCGDDAQILVNTGVYHTCIRLARTLTDINTTDRKPTNNLNNQMLLLNTCTYNQGRAQTFRGTVAQTKKKGHKGLLIKIVQLLQIYNQKRRQHTVIISHCIDDLIRVTLQCCFCLIVYGSREEWAKLTPCILATVYFYCHVTVYFGTTHHFCQTVKRRNMWGGKGRPPFTLKTMFRLVKFFSA